MLLSKKNKYFILLIAVAAIVTSYTLSHMVTHPGSSLVTIGGDGVKNYYSYLFHVTNGSGLYFEGMNYPYGEHIVYTDGQPLLSVPLSVINKYFPLSYGGQLGLLHIALVLSFFFAIVFTYKIITRFKVHPLYAIICSTLIVLMSPQLFRMHGHFGLGYQCIVPMLFYWNIRYNDTRKTLYIILILILGITSTLLHPYFAALFFIWLMLFVFGYLLIAKSRQKDNISHVAPIVLVSLGIIGFVKVFMFLTDKVEDRTTHPYGTLSACTTGKDIFTSESSPIWQAARSFSLIEKTGSGEGLAYLGIVGLVVLSIAIIVILLNTIKKERNFNLSKEAGFSSIWLFIALGSFLLAQGAPFVWHMEWLLDYVASFRQFRSLGRFALLFYYIGTVYIVILLYTKYKIYKAKGNKSLAYTILVIPLLIWSLEANGYIIASRKAISNAQYNYNTIFKENNWKEKLKQQWFKPSDFQGIIILPYVHVGSEKVWINGDNAWAFTLGVSGALQLDLPMVNVYMSRTSWSQTFNQIKTIAGPFVDKPIFDTVKNNKPFLLVHWFERELDQDCRYLIDNASHIDRLGQCDLYALYPEKIKVSDMRYKDSFMSIAHNMSSLDTCINTNNQPYIIDHFDEDSISNYLFDNKCRVAESQEGMLIKEYKINPMQDSSLYEVSIWSLVNDIDYRTPTYIFQTFNSNGKETSHNYIKTSQSTDSKGDLWMRANKYISIPANTTVIKLTLNQGDSNNYIALDEFLFRPANAITISKLTINKNSLVMINNHILDGNRKQY